LLQICCRCSKSGQLRHRCRPFPTALCPARRGRALQPRPTKPMRAQPDEGQDQASCSGSIHRKETRSKRQRRDSPILLVDKPRYSHRYRLNKQRDLVDRPPRPRHLPISRPARQHISFRGISLSRKWLDRNGVSGQLRSRHRPDTLPKTSPVVGILARSVKIVMSTDNSMLRSSRHLQWAVGDGVNRYHPSAHGNALRQCGRAAIRETKIEKDQPEREAAEEWKERRAREGNPIAFLGARWGARKA
jgi:hypothetical protein